jgi:hypothetical protein
MKLEISSLIRIAGVQALAVIALSGSLVHATQWNTCGGNNIRWNGSRADMYISTTSFPIDSSWDGDLQSAMWHWNNVKGSGLNFYVGRDSDGNHNSSNGRNEIYFDVSETGTGTVLAVTHVRSHCYWFFGWNYGIDETDIAFNTSKSWNTGGFSYSNLGSPYSFEGVALHELGHALGLNHEDRWMATMNSIYPNGGPLGYYKEFDPNADDRVGARSLYPDGTTETDIAGSALKSTGSGTSGLISSPLSAARGGYATVDFTFSNLSTSSETFDVGFYLSSNDIISTGDVLLGMNYGAWGSSGFTGTFSRTLYIPTWITPGTYYLGFLLDPSNSIAETNEANNIQPMPRTITIY